MSVDHDAKATALSDAKRALLLKRLRGEGGGTAAFQAQQQGIPRREGTESVIPMSFAQERMWFADQMEPGTALYHVAAAVLISAKVDIPTLDRALTEVRRRHEALRTTYSMVDGKPLQTIRPVTPWRADVEDIRAALDAAPDRDAELQRRLSIEGKRPFDLANGPVSRAKVFRVSENDCVLSLTVHHIATDGWAMPIISKELGTIYDAFLEGRPSPLEEPEIQYADYTLWQRDYLQGATLQKQLGYWKDRLAGTPPLEMPGDHPRPAVSTHKGDFWRFTIGGETTEAVRALARREHVTVNMVIMAAFNVLLHRYTAQEDVAVGTLLGNRNRRETESMVGVTVNTAVLRTDLSGDPTFLDLVAQTRKHMLDADAHQDVPFEKVVEELGIERDLSRHPLFQVMYFHHTFVKSHKSGTSHLDIRPLYEYGVSLVDIHVSQFDLSLATLELQGGLSCLMEYSTDLFTKEGVVRLCRNFEAVLREVCDRPEARLSTFVGAMPEEVATVTGEWSRPLAELPEGASETPVHELFAAAARRTPGAVALLWDGGSMTFRELEERSARLANHLRGRGVGPETRVGICMERSAEMFVGVLGILRAGGAYVPMDPQLPAERLAYLAEDAGARLVLTQERFAEKLAGVPVLRIDADWDAVRAESAAAPESGVSAENAAYLIYTSGSTGRPKAVVTPHRGLSNYIQAAVAMYDQTGDDRTLQFASLSFDASKEEIYTPLVTGGTLVLRSEEWLESMEAFCRKCDEAGVTIFAPPTAFWHELASQLDAGTVRLPDSMRIVIVGGERALPERLAAWRRSVDPKRVRFFNSYGPTETTIASTAYEVTERDDREPRHEVPIGRPVAGMRAYVLDAHLNPLPIGVPGELCLSGAGVARGYQGRPGQTAGVFVPDPFSGVPGARMYRTGDRVRWTPDGQIEFVGRVDDQVKVRGFRVELGEIDAALAADPALRDAVTVLRDGAAGQKRLVAYVVPSAPAAEQGELVQAVRSRLKERLPEYMVPSAFVVMEALPLTVRNKVDRRALPAPEPQTGEEAPAFVAAGTPLEETLSRIWAEVLRVPQVGMHDNFFELGGDSILSIQVIARAAQEGIRLTPKQMFQHQTVAELAPHAGTAAEVRAEQGTLEGEAPLTPIQHVFFEGITEGRDHWNQAFVFRAAAPLDVPALRAALRAVAAHHDALRLRYAQDASGRWTQRFAGADEEIPVEVVDLSGVPAAEQAAAVEARSGDAQAALSIERGPIVRAVVFGGMADGRERLLLAIHHLVVDAVSWAILLEDLGGAYAAILAGQEPSFPRKTTSFRQWGERLAEYAAGDDLRREAGYWSSAIPTPAPAVPVDMDGPNTESTARAVGVSLDEEETRALLTDVPPVYGTQANDVLLAALALAFGEWTGRRSVLIDLEGHGREDLFEDVDLSRTVGWFTSLFPVHVEVDEGAGPGEALKQVKETLRRIPHKGIGYGLLRHLCPDEDLATMLRAQPRAQVSFNYLGQFGGASGAMAEGEEPLLSGAAEGAGPVHSPVAPREHLIQVDSLVQDGRLHLSWWYGAEVLRRETVERLAEGYLTALRGLIAHCKDPQAGGFTPSDFPGAVGLDQGSLDSLMAQIGFD